MKIEIKGKMPDLRKALDNASFEVACPKCGRKFKHTVGGLERSKKVTCTCGAEITIKGK